MASKRIVMLKTAAGPAGVYKRGKAYIVPPDVYEQFTEGDSPAALDYSEAAELRVETRGETPEEPAPDPPTEIDPPGDEPKKPRRRGGRAAAKS